MTLIHLHAIKYYSYILYDPHDGLGYLKRMAALNYIGKTRCIYTYNESLRLDKNIDKTN